MRLSLCMIVRDNRKILEECLTSIRPWVDEMIVVDTGSKDGTPELASSLGARVSNFPWTDDFSAARNASLEEARGEWLFWMDSDDVIDESNGRKLRDLAAGPHAPQTFGYVMQVHCPGVGGVAAGDVTVVDHIKLIRNRPELRFEGRIHEQILPAIRRAGGEVAWSDLFVTHKHGSVTPTARAAKHVRDLRILDSELSERGEHPFVLFNLGMTYADMEEPRQAAGYLERSIRVAGPHESHLAKAFSLLIACRMQTQEWACAEEVAREAVSRFPDDAEIRFRSAVVAGQCRRTDEAIEIYRDLLRRRATAESRRFTSCDVGIVGHKARHNLAIHYSEQGRWGEAELQWRLALDEAPHFQPALTSLGQALLEQRKRTTAGETVRHWRRDVGTRCAANLLEARIAEGAHDLPRAIEILHRTRSEFSPEADVLEMLGRLLFAAERFKEATAVLVELSELRPRDPSAAHNLGAAYLALGFRAEAQAELRRSLQLRPDAQATRNLLAQANG